MTAIYRDGDRVLRAEAVLTGNYVASAALDNVCDFRRISIAVKYVGNAGSAIGYPRFALQWSVNDTWYDAVRENGLEYVVDERDGPVAGAGVTVYYVLAALNPGGVSAVRVRVKEQGDAANPGSCEIRANAGS